LDSKKALKIACGFGSGMGRMGKTCGVATGAFMVIGLKYGKSTAEEDAGRQKTYELINEFVRKFEKLNGTTGCRELIGFDLTTPEGQKAARDADIFNKVCTKYIRDSVKILEEMGF
jgi:C_GCAxxG_C_C family probable redox protein